MEWQALLIGILAGSGTVLIALLLRQKGIWAQIARLEQLVVRIPELEALHREDLSRCEALLSANTALEKKAAEQAALACERLAQIATLHAEREAARQEIEQLQGRVATCSARIEVLREQEVRQGDEKITLLMEARTQLKEEFQNLSRRIFDERTSSLSEHSRAQLEGVLSPLREQLGEFKRRIDDVHDRESRDRAALRQELSHLRDLNTSIGREAVNLTRALKGDSKARGTWGEVILKRLLEESGLCRGREYEPQVSLPDAHGKRYQPDVIVHLPEDRDVIIDAKVSLNAYERYCSAEDDQGRSTALREHLSSLRTHIRELSTKNYADLPGLRSLDFVLMFIPVESAFLAALEGEHGLFTEALDKDIVLVSPSTLLVTLRIIHTIWQDEYQHTHAQEIAKRAGDLYDHFVRFVNALEEIGRHLEKAQAAYDLAHKRLASGKGNLVSRTAALKQLGVKAKRELPPALAAVTPGDGCED